MFGAAAELRTGDIAVISGALPPITTLDRQPKHAWCAVGGVTPVDLSATFAGFPQAPQLRSPVTGDGPNGDWQVRHAEDESILDQNIEGANELIYISRGTFFDEPGPLLEEPSRFIPTGEEPRVTARASTRRSPCTAFAARPAAAGACATAVRARRLSRRSSRNPPTRARRSCGSSRPEPPSRRRKPCAAATS
jgi:hypothetical protein